MYSLKDGKLTTKMVEKEDDISNIVAVKKLTVGDVRDRICKLVYHGKHLHYCFVVTQAESLDKWSLGISTNFRQSAGECILSILEEGYVVFDGTSQIFMPNDLETPKERYFSNPIKQPSERKLL